LKVSELGLVHIYTGEGKGKTTAAIGLGIRCLGAGLRVNMVSFLKNPGSSEFCALSRIAPQFQIIIANQKPRGFYWKLSPAEKTEILKDYQTAYAQILEMITQQACEVLILDEIMAVLKYGIFSVESILLIIQQCRERHIELILTGRNAPIAVLDAADLVTEMKEIKHPMANGTRARKGIEY